MTVSPPRLLRRRILPLATGAAVALTLAVPGIAGADTTAPASVPAASAAVSAPGAVSAVPVATVSPDDAGSWS